MYDVPSWKKELKQRLDAMRSRKAEKQFRVRKAAEVEAKATAPAQTPTAA